jgi:hypothetical protein
LNDWLLTPLSHKPPIVGLKQSAAASMTSRVVKASALGKALVRDLVGLFRFASFGGRHFQLRFWGRIRFELMSIADEQRGVSPEQPSSHLLPS